MAALRIIYMGTPNFSVPALKALHEAGHEIAGVYTQPPRPKGRGQQVQKSPVHLYAEAHGLPVFTPKSLKKTPEQEEFAALKPDVAIVAAYGLILPKAVLNAPKHGCINIHASLLPRWRGASPIQQSIWKGDRETGIAIMQMDEGLDTGPVIAMRAVPITPQTDTPSLHGALCALGGAMIVEVIGRLAAGETVTRAPQDNTHATYAPLLTKEDGRVNWNQTAEEIHRQIRALTPWPGVWTELDGKRIKILGAAVASQTSEQSGGTITDRHGYIACGENTTLQILTLQPPDKKPMDFAAAVNGGYIHVGSRFS